MKVYTRKGDDGSTALGDGSRTSKAAERVAAYGDVDELSSVIGVLRAEELPEPTDGQLARAQEALFEVGAFLAHPGHGRGPGPHVTDPGWLEAWIDGMEDDLHPLRNFILPGGSRPAALSHLARTVCRRAERRTVTLLVSGDDGAGRVLPFLNRLSDTFFVLARWLNRHAGVADVIWSPRG